MSGYDEVDIDSLPFEEYAQVMCEQGAAEFGDPNKPKLTFQEIVASDMTYSEIEAEYGEETAINSGIARDPDTWMWTDEDFARAKRFSKAVTKTTEG